MRVFTMALVIYLDYKVIFLPGLECFNVTFIKSFLFIFGWISAKVLQQREKWASNPNTLWEKAHERNAKRVLSLIVELGGLWVKLGQYMSTRADVLPDAYISRLKLLQDSLPPRPLQEVFFYPTYIYNWIIFFIDAWILLIFCTSFFLFLFIISIRL